MNQPNKRIYGIPLIVDHMVQERVNNSNDVVIEIVLNRIAMKAQQSEFRKEYGVNEDWHARRTPVGPYDRGCGCVYCETFHRYVSTKISAHRMRRRIDDVDWCRPTVDTSSYEMLKLLNEEWVRLRALKNRIKELTGL